MSTLLASDARISLVSPLTSAGAAETAARKAASPAGASAWGKVFEQLQQLHQLHDDWDGQGAKAPEPSNLASALAWVQGMRLWPQALPPDQVTPGVAGEMYLVWQRPGLLLEAEICRSDAVEWLLTIEGQPPRQWETGQDILWLVARLADDSPLSAAPVQP